MDAQAKLKAKTGLTETKVILGWLLNFWTMTIALPEDKFIAYSQAISDMIKRGWTSKAELKMNIGQWVHLGQVLPFHPPLPQQASFPTSAFGEEKTTKIE